MILGGGGEAGERRGAVGGDEAEGGKDGERKGGGWMRGRGMGWRGWDSRMNADSWCLQITRLCGRGCQYE